MQQSLTLGCHISFEAITSEGNERTLYNSLNDQDEISEV